MLLWWDSPFPAATKIFDPSMGVQHVKNSREN